MENKSPYVHEKPLRLKANQRSAISKTVGFSALGVSLLGLALGNLVAVQANPTESSATAQPPGANFAAQALPESQATVSLPAPVYAQVSPTGKAKTDIVLPVIANLDFSNTSSATPYATGSYSNSVNSEESDDYEGND